jgi:hypothetical protein
MDITYISTLQNSKMFQLISIYEFKHTEVGIRHKQFPEFHTLLENLANIHFRMMRLPVSSLDREV